MFQGEPIDLEIRLSISRVTSNLGTDWIEIQIDDVISGCRISTTEIDLADFSKAITGMGHVYCTSKFFLQAPIGKKKEIKTEKLQRPVSVHTSCQEVTGKKILSSYEVNGWKGRREDLWNSHRWITLEDGSPGISVTFYRWVDPEPFDTR